MDQEVQIIQLDKPDDSLKEVVGGGIYHFNFEYAGEEQHQQVCFALHTQDQKIVGGLIGDVFWGWFFIKLLFINHELRGCGYGHRLLTMAEEEARKLGAKNVYLDTFSFQAPDFYRKHGYQVFGELKDFPPGHQRYFLTKEL